MKEGKVIKVAFFRDAEKGEEVFVVKKLGLLKIPSFTVGRYDNQSLVHAVKFLKDNIGAAIIPGAIIQFSDAEIEKITAGLKLEKRLELFWKYTKQRNPNLRGSLDSRWASVEYPGFSELDSRIIEHIQQLILVHRHRY